MNGAVLSDHFSDHTLSETEVSYGTDVRIRFVSTEVVGQDIYLFCLDVNQDHLSAKVY